MSRIKDRLKEIMNHAVIYGVGSAIQSLIGFAFLPLFTKYFNTDEFGIFSLIQLAGTLAGALFFFGASSALTRFYFEEDTPAYRKKAASTALNITLFGIICQLLIGVFFSGSLSVFLTDKADYAPHIFYMLIASSLGILQNFLLVILRLEKKSKTFIIANISGTLVNFLLVYYMLIYAHQGIYAPIAGLIGGNGIVVLICLLVLKGSFHFSFRVPEFKAYLLFGIPTILNGLSYYFLDWLDRFMIKEFGTLSDVGVYSMGYKIGMIIYILFITPFSMIWSTVRMQYAKQANADQLTTRVVSYFSVAGLFIVLLLSLFSKEILQVFSGNKEYVVAYKVVPWIMMACLVNGYANILDYGIYQKKKIHYYYSILLLSCVLNAALNYLLIPRYGYIAAAYVTLATYLFYIAVLYLISNRYHYIRIEWARVIPLFIFAGGALALNSQVSFSGLADFVFKAALLLAALLSFFFLWMQPGEKEHAYAAIAKITGGKFFKGRQ